MKATISRIAKMPVAQSASTMTVKEEPVYPVSEVFESIQGEATHSGTPMAFIRLAGCNVGKPYTHEARKALDFPMWQERCTDWTGVSFPCDTDFRTKKRYPLSELLTCLEVQRSLRVSITGGEPFIHDIEPLVKGLSVAGKKVHIETSGTLPVTSVLKYHPWIVCSPKQGFLMSVVNLADDIKILVGPSFDEEKFLYEFRPLIHTGKVWLQPIDAVGEDNIPRCLQILDKYRGLRLSLQLHKYIDVR